MLTAASVTHMGSALWAATRFADAGVVELNLGIGIALKRAKALYERMLDTARKSLRPLGHGY